MRIEHSVRGFRFLMHPAYLSGVDKRLVSESSAIRDDIENAMIRPGSSFLWFGDLHHLNREQVTVLVAALQTWLETGRLSETIEKGETQ